MPPTESGVAVVVCIDIRIDRGRLHLARRRQADHLGAKGDKA
jgi:hypothetical protein